MSSSRTRWKKFDKRDILKRILRLWLITQRILSSNPKNFEQSALSAWSNFLPHRFPFLCLFLEEILTKCLQTLETSLSKCRINEVLFTKLMKRTPETNRSLFSFKDVSDAKFDSQLTTPHSLLRKLKFRYDRRSG